MSPRTRRLASFCLLSGLALAVVGQFYFAWRRDYMWDGVFFYGVASALFLAAVRLARLDPPALPHKPGWRVVLDWVAGRPGPTLLIVASALATLTVGARAAGSLTADQGYALLKLWGAGVLAYLAAPADYGAIWAWLRGWLARQWANPWELLLLLGLTAAAAVTRLIALDRIPYILGGDEASMGVEALGVLRGRLTNPFATGWFSHPTMFFYLLAFALRLLGATIAGLRAVPALAGVLTIPAVYLLARELFDRRVAAVAAAYLAAYHYAIHFSRLGLNNALDPLLATLSFLFLALGTRTRRAGCFALAGVFLGLDQYAYTGARVMPLVLAAYLVYLAWRQPGFWALQRWNLLILAGGFLVTGWPLFLFFARHPQDFMARVTQLGIIQSGWLANTAASLQRSPASLLWEQFVKSALAFNYFYDPTPFYGPRMPLLDFLSAVPFTFGLIYAMARWRQPKHGLLALWFWAVLIFGGVLLENPPSSQRLLLSIVPVSIFVSLGITLLAQVAGQAFRWRPSSPGLAVALAVVCLGAINLRFYFGVYSQYRTYGGVNNEVGHEMGLYLHQLGAGHRYYFFGAPRMFAGFSTVAYLAPEVPGVDVLEPLAGPPDFVTPDLIPVFVFLPERLGELEAVRLSYPQGAVREFDQPSGAQLFVAYEPSEVPNGTQP